LAFSKDGIIESGPIGTPWMRFDADTTAGCTRFLLWDINKASLNRVCVGADDSGGLGWKMLRVQN
jgi:hypothetical protein